MRKLLSVLCLCALVFGMTGCASSNKSTIFSAHYWKRHVEKIGEGLHQFRVDIDRTIFDLDDRPLEEL